MQSRALGHLLHTAGWIVVAGWVAGVAVGTEAVRRALIELSHKVEAPADEWTGRLYPPPPGHAAKEAAEALILRAEILAGRLEQAGKELALAG